MESAIILQSLSQPDWGPPKVLNRLITWRETLLSPRSKGDLEALAFWQRAIIVPTRIALAVSLDILQGQLTLRAMSLVYTTLLSLVPLLAISFSILKGFGVHNRVEPFLQGLLEPLGEKGVEITVRIIDFVNNIQVGVLGFVGFLLLFYTVISLLQKVERSLNYIWHVPKERSIPQKVRDYLSAVILGPVLIIGGMGVFATLMSSNVVASLTAIGPLGLALEQVGRFTSLAIIIGTFAFIYAFLPNTKVHFWPAIFGGTIAAAMWVVIGWGFASFVVGSAKYTVIYSAFATLVLFMIWLYLVWLIVLIGSSVSFYSQNPHYIGIRRDAVRYAITLMEKAALVATYHIVRDWYAGGSGWTVERLAEETEIPTPVMTRAVETLEKAGLFATAGDENPQYVPTLPPETTPVRAILNAIRTDEGTGHPTIAVPDTPPPVEAIVERIEKAVAYELGGLSIKDFALADAPPTPLHQVVP